MKKKVYAVAILIPLIVGGISALITRSAMMEYVDNVAKPSFAPPALVFPIAWSILYVLMGISSGMVYLSESDDKREALTVYAVQLAVNFLWSIIFFNLELRLFAFWWLLLLLALVLVMTWRFYKIKKWAGYLNIPYIAWLIFAAVLNYSIWMLNR